MRVHSSIFVTWLVVATAGSVRAADPIVVDPSCDTGRGFSIATIGSRPAIAYRCAPDFQVRFVVARDPRGDQWSAPIVIAGSCEYGYGYGYSTSLAEVDGRPAITYDEHCSGGTSDTLRYVRANDPLGESWPSPTIVAPGRFSVVDLGVVAGRPAVVGLKDVGGVIYVRAGDPAGATWPAPLSIGGGAYVSLLTFGETPAIGYLASGGPVVYRRATNAVGSAWGTPVAAAPASSASNLQFIEVNGYPAACWREVSELRYVRATAADGSTWGTSQSLAAATTDPSFAVIGGVPAIAYRSDGLWFLGAGDPTGASWSTPIPVTSDVYHRETQLIEADGLPALSFYETLRKEVLFTRANSVDFSGMYAFPTTADFGYVATGETADVEISLTNYRDATVHVANSSVVGEDAGRFRVTAGDAPFTLGPGDSRFITLEFHAAPPGEKHATLVLDTDDAIFPTVEVPIKGWASNCRFEAITQNSGADLPHIMITSSANGRVIAFASDWDLLPNQNADLNREIFVWEEGVGLQQLTDTTGIVNNYPSISNDGQWVVFESKADLVAGSNVDGSTELFLVQLSNGDLTQITDGNGVSFGQPSVSDRGKVVSCISDVDLGSNPDRSSEVFLLEVESLTLTQVTDTIGATNWRPQLAGSGGALVFQSRLDVVPGSNPDHNYEIFIYREGSSITQITNTGGGSNERPTVDQNGRRIAFLSDRDLVPGGNPDGSTEVFLWDDATGFLQITETTSASQIYAPSINDAGNRVALVTDAELIEGLNHDLSEEVFLYDVETGVLSQVTYLPAGAYVYPVSTGSARMRVAFGSTADVVGGGSSWSFDVYLATCGLLFDNFMSGDLRQWESGGTSRRAIDGP